MQTSYFGVEIVVDGRVLQDILHGGKVFVEAVRGQEFNIRLPNYTDGRIEIVISVDGLSIMDGKDASRNKGGYILRSRQTAEIPGWRLNHQSAASFVFGSLPESYAVQMDKPNNVGVIGAVAFAEKPRQVLPPVIVNNQQVGSCGGDGGAKRTIGTGFGRQQEFNTSEISFERGMEISKIAIYYNDRAGLLAAGIPLWKLSALQQPSGPDPFPADSEGCQPPKGWRGK